MSGYCSECGAPIPDGQMICSMCYGDPDHGRDGYYQEYLRKMDQMEFLQREEELMRQEEHTSYIIPGYRNIGDHFHALFESSYNLIDRFGAGLMDAPCWYKMTEEWSEFLNECYGGTNDDALAEEAVDVIVTMINYLRSMGITDKRLSRAMAKVTEKNNAKSRETHEVRNGMIVRKK